MLVWALCLHLSSSLHKTGHRPVTNQTLRGEYLQTETEWVLDVRQWHLPWGWLGVGRGQHQARVSFCLPAVALQQPGGELPGLDLGAGQRGRGELRLLQQHRLHLWGLVTWQLQLSSNILVTLNYTCLCLIDFSRIMRTNLSQIISVTLNKRCYSHILHVISNRFTLS